jgi:hypothetical protein
MCELWGLAAQEKRVPACIYTNNLRDRHPRKLGNHQTRQSLILAVPHFLLLRLVTSNRSPLFWVKILLDLYDWTTMHIVRKLRLCMVKNMIYMFALSAFLPFFSVVSQSHSSWFIFCWCLKTHIKHLQMLRLNERVGDHNQHQRTSLLQMKDVFKRNLEGLSHHSHDANCVDFFL